MERAWNVSGEFTWTSHLPLVDWVRVSQWANAPENLRSAPCLLSFFFFFLNCVDSFHLYALFHTLISWRLGFKRLSFPTSPHHLLSSRDPVFLYVGGNCVLSDGFLSPGPPSTVRVHPAQEPFHPPQLQDLPRTEKREPVSACHASRSPRSY